MVRPPTTRIRQRWPWLVPSLGLLALAVVFALRAPERVRGVAPTFAAAEGSAVSSEPAAELVPPRADALGAAEDAAPGQRESAATPGALVAGRVEAEGGIPAGDEVVVVAHAHPTGVPGLRSRALEAPVARDGSFALEVPADTHSVSLGLEARLLTLAEDVDVVPPARDVVLRPTVLAEVVGHAFLPLGIGGGAAITVSCRESSVVAADDGAFALVVGAGKPLQLEAECRVADEAGDGALFGVGVALAPLSPGERRAVDLFLTRCIVLRGIVTDTEGVAIPDATIRATPLAPVASARDPDSRSRADGSFQLEPLWPGEWRIRARAAKHFSAEATVVLPAEARSRLHLVLGAPAVVRGRVLEPDGSPADDALIFTSDGDFRLASNSHRVGNASGLSFQFTVDSTRNMESLVQSSAADGTFEFSLGLPSIALQAYSTPHALARPRSLDLRPGQVVEDVVLWLQPTCKLRGTVVDEDGRQVLGDLLFESSGLQVRLELVGGSFVGDWLPPGPARITLYDAARSAGLEGSCEVELSPERETVFELRLTGKRPR